MKQIWILKIRRPADEELKRARRSYKAKGGLALAHRFQNAWLEAVDRIAENPYLGSPHDKGTRIVKMKKFPYYVIYLVEDPDCIVVAVMFNRSEARWHRRVP